MPAMPPRSELTDLGERILYALWKLKGIGQYHVSKDLLGADLGASTSDETLTEAIANLRDKGFLQTFSTDGHPMLSLTALGLAILRQIEEDRLEELS